MTHHSVVFLVLRRMRVPLIVLIVIYAISVLGLVLIPGVDAQGQPAPPLSFFHAFYFISYTASTIGFGEIPTAFSDAQRMWVTLCIFLTVIGWSYSIFTLLALLQDAALQQTLVATRFARRVAHLGEPFYIVCGCGETGTRVVRNLDHHGFRVVAIDQDENRIQELELDEFHSDVLTLCADANLPDTLQWAGLQRQNCRGVLALTNHDAVNLSVAIATRLLHPSVPVFARVENEPVALNMASFGTHHIINPYQKFADYLGLAVHAPHCCQMLMTLTGTPGDPLPIPHEPPRGEWIICGYGRFGRAVSHALGQQEDISLTVVEPLPNATEEGVRQILGTGTEAAPLLAAGVKQAVGLVVGSDDDINNLSIAMTAKALNPHIFIVIRQNKGAHDALFQALKSDYVMMPARVVAQASFAILTTPLLPLFLDAVRQWPDSQAHSVMADLIARCGNTTPRVWGVKLNASGAPALHRAQVFESLKVPLNSLTHDPAQRDRPLPLLPLLLLRDERVTLLPEGKTILAAGDALLFAGAPAARSAQQLALDNRNALDYLLLGHERSGWLWRKCGWGH